MINVDTKFNNLLKKNIKEKERVDIEIVKFNEKKIEITKDIEEINVVLDYFKNQSLINKEEDNIKNLILKRYISLGSVKDVIEELCPPEFGKEGARYLRKYSYSEVMKILDEDNSCDEYLTKVARIVRKYNSK